MFVPHVSLQVELFELREATEAQQADDLAAQVVAQVPRETQAFEPYGRNFNLCTKRSGYIWSILKYR